jgi:hypothetical protein
MRLSRPVFHQPHFFSTHPQDILIVRREVLENQSLGSYQIVFGGPSEVYRHTRQANPPLAGGDDLIEERL